MIRGTDTQFKFKLPCTFFELASANIVFWQPYNDGPSADRALPIIKTLDQCTSTATWGELLVTLDREETLRFSDDRKAYVQFLAFTYRGEPITHKKHPITVYPIHEALISDAMLPDPQDEGWIYTDGNITT